MTQQCPLCLKLGHFFYKNHNVLFYDCKNCKGVFRTKESRLDPDKEKNRYQQHNNDVFDVNYQKFVSPITSAILSKHTKEDFGLDFGAGTGPVISKILDDNHFQIEQYDPYFNNKVELLTKNYDYIACCEVIEHFYNPEKEFRLLKNLLKSNGVLYCMTEFFNDSINFSTWYYKDDPTHVFLYRKETVEWIKYRFGFKEVIIKNRLIILVN